MAAPSWQEYYDLGKAEAIRRRPDLTFGVGDITEMLMAGAGAMADHLTGFFARRIKATFLDGARGDDLTVLADDHWAVLRKRAVQASGSVTFTRAALTGPSGTIAIGTVVGTSQDSLGQLVEYTLNSALSWALNEQGPKSVDVTAIYPGTAGNVAAGKVVNISTPLFDTFTVTNAARMVGGDVEETDNDLRERVRALPKALRRATLDAIEYGALLVPSVKRATAVDALDGAGNKTGIVNLYVSDVDGGSSPGMLSDVRTELVNWAAGGIIVNVYGGVLQPVAVAVTLTVRAGSDTQAIAAKVKLAIVARVAKLKIGESLYPDEIATAVRNVDDNIRNVTVTNPATAVVLDPTDPAEANKLIRVDGIPTVS